MKNILSKIGSFLLDIVLMALALIAFLIFGIYFLVSYPFARHAYRKSHYFKDLKRKFSFFFCHSDCYQFYNMIKENNLPIAFIPDPEKSDHYGYFQYQDILISVDRSNICFDSSLGCWMTEEEDEAVKVEDVLAEEMDALRTIRGEECCKRAVVLLDEDDFSEDDLPYARLNKMFLIHDGSNTADIIKEFIAQHSK